MNKNFLIELLLPFHQPNGAGRLSTRKPINFSDYLGTLHIFFNDSFTLLAEMINMPLQI